MISFLIHRNFEVTFGGLNQIVMYPEILGGVPFPAGSLGAEAHENLKGYDCNRWRITSSFKHI